MKELLRLIIEKCKKSLSRKFREENPQVTYIIIAVVAFIIVAIFIHLFLELTENLKAEYMAQIDMNVSQYIISFRTPALTNYFTFITNVGDSIGYICVFGVSTLLFYLIFKSWRYVIQLALISLLAISSNLILKQVINRARPISEHLVTVETLSYPSGHAMSAMAFYGFLIYLFYNFKLNKIIKIGVIILLVVLILSIGISRIYLGVHFPSDIAGGFIAGFIWVILCIFILNVIQIFNQDSDTEKIDNDQEITH